MHIKLTNLLVCVCVYIYIFMNSKSCKILIKSKMLQIYFAILHFI